MASVRGLTGPRRLTGASQPRLRSSVVLVNLVRKPLCGPGNLVGVGRVLLRRSSRLARRDLSVHLTLTNELVQCVSLRPLVIISVSGRLSHTIWLPHNG